MSAEDWSVIYPILMKHRHARSTSGEQSRAFLVAVLQILRSGSQWRLLPEAHGNWNAVFKRFSRWSMGSGGRCSPDASIILIC
ncbi:transposase [Candidatus Methylospira mobilis]|nr:transposase [Candidatus Methylospira mobilis]